MTSLPRRNRFTTVPINYPQVGCYSGFKSYGFPFITGTVEPGGLGGTIDENLCEKQGWYDTIVIDPANAVTEGDKMRDALRLIRRSAGPRSRILQYWDAGRLFVCGQGYYGQTSEPGGCKHNTFAYQAYELSKASGDVLYNTGDGDPYWSAYNNPLFYDYAKNTQFPIKLAQLALSWGDYSEVFDGIFMDEFCSDIQFTQGTITDPASPKYLSVQSIDYARSGFATIGAWAAAYAGGWTSHVNYLRNNNNYREHMVCGNCGPYPPQGSLVHGWMGEQFPTQNPGGSISWANWRTLVLDLVDTRFLQPRVQFITNNRFQVDFYNGTINGIVNGMNIQQAIRFGLGTATLYDHVCYMLPNGNVDGVRGFATDQWFEEYSVDRTGQVTFDNTKKGWMGQPLAPYYTAGGIGQLYARDYEHGRVVVNPTASPVPYTAPGYIRIKGTHANDGKAISSVPAYDAVFLIQPY